MSIEDAFQGSLFANDFLRESIVELADWQSIDEAALEDFRSSLRAIFDRFPIEQTPNESQTEDDLIWPVLECLGWTASLRQQNLAVRGRDDVPDGLLFADDAAKARANGFAEEWKRYGFGLAVVESKRWLRPLDRRSGRRGEETAPSTQMLRYLRRVDDLTTGKLRWGILTNGSRWRLYYQGAQSVSEQFFAVDLAAVLDLPGHNEGLFALTEADRRHLLKVFALVFRREAFLPAAADPRTFHQRALEEGKFYEERVAASLSDLVFGQVFPELARAIAAAAPDAPLQEVREAALILLYRLLFILYAEDRDLLPVRDERYDDYGLREKVRGDVGSRKDRNDVFSATAARYWLSIDDLCRAIDQGDAAIGLPPYNGGLFDRERTPLLANIRLGDQVMADVIDALSFERTPEGRRYINYRDLSVQQLGSIYERLVEHDVIRDGEQIIVRPNIFARKGSGSYYTPEDLVGLILGETIAPLVRSRMDAFTARIAELADRGLAEDRRIGVLKRIDPAEKLLELKICDPAMGSGHFLVSLVDILADQVITAMAEAEAAVDDYISPLSDRIDTIRITIMGNAEERGWTIDAEQLDDRHIIRRMVLKRCVYGVDKNPMAVELAKVALWLHTFTVGAPLSFLDHHLHCGDSPSGEWVPLYEGKMVQAFDHRAASVVVNPENQHRPAQPVPATLDQHQDPNWLPDPQFWVAAHETTYPNAPFLLGFKDVTAPTNARSMIAGCIPGFGAGNTLPLILADGDDARLPAQYTALLLGNFNAVPLDFVARQKIQGQHLNWFIVEQLPVVPMERYEAVRFGPKTAAEIVREAVLELTYTAHDMTPFARDMGYVDDAGNVKPPSVWDEERRLLLRAKLDAVFFHLYGVTDRDDVRYVFSTFPIVERQETEAYGGYRSRDLCLAYMNALAAGNPDAEIRL